jgi:hypothetical protein
VRRRVELRAELVGGEPVAVARSRLWRAACALPVFGSSVGPNFAGPKPFQTGMLGVIEWVRSM